MIHRTKLATTAAVATALTLGGIAPAWAATITIRQADLIGDRSGTGAQGTVEWLADGLHLETGDNTAPVDQPANNTAAEYWERTGGLPDNASLTWNGSANRPAVHLVFDTDGNRGNAGSRNVLVGEAANNGTFWYVGGQIRAQERGISCPATTEGLGSDCHGTLLQWQGTLADEELYEVGFSLTGVDGDGVLRSVSVDDDTYRFTSNNPPGPDPVVTPVTGHADAFKARNKRKAVVRMWTDPMAAGQVEGRKARFSIYVDGKRVFRAVKGEDTVARWSRKFQKRTGKHTVQVFANGDLADQIRIKTGKPRR